MVTKTYFDYKTINLNQKINSNKTKHLHIGNELKNQQTFDPIYFGKKSHFEEDGTHNYLVFQPMYRYFKRVTGADTGNYICFWKSKGLSNENITAPTESDYNLNPQLSYLGNKIRAEFKESSLKQDKITYTHGKVVNIYIVYETSKNLNISSYSAIEKCLFGAVSFTENADFDQYKYSGYRIGFDRH